MALRYNIKWTDINTNPVAVPETGTSLNQIREKLYVKDTNDQLNIALDASTHLWSQTNGQRWLARLLRLIIFKQVSRLIYNLFARLLYYWNCNKKRW